MASNLLDTDSEDELPAGWEERVTADGRVYYANHSQHTTQWQHPATGKKKRVAGELPYGWERKVTDSNHIYYVDHVNNKTTYTDPRLAFAVEDRGGCNETAKQRYDGSSSAQQVLLGRDLTGKYAIVTGSDKGIGFETARSLALHGATVVMACRNMKSALAAGKSIRKERSKAQVYAMYCDLNSLHSVRQFVTDYLSKKWPLHILVLNAGVFGLPYSVTEDGYETTFQTNHLGHFLLATSLTELMVESKPARMVIVTSESHRFTDLNQRTISEQKLNPPENEYRPILAYNQSKLCNVLLSCELNYRLEKRGVTCNAVHPGNMISSHLPRNWWFYRFIFAMVRPFSKSKQQGAASSVYCAAARELEGVGGQYYINCFRVHPSDEALVSKTSQKLWDISELMIEKALSRVKQSTSTCVKVV